MQVILLQKIENLGQMGDQVNVKPGYARNFLIPFSKALPATTGNVEYFESRRAELEQLATDAVTRAQGRARAITAVGTIEITANAGPGGKLFGSVGPQDIADALTAAGVEVSKAEIRMAEPLRSIGDAVVSVHLHSDVDANINVSVLELDSEAAAEE